MKPRILISGVEVILVNLENFDPEHHILKKLGCENVLWLFILPSYDTDSHAPQPAEWFSSWLEESANDFRVSQSLLTGMLYGLFGVGDSAYGDNFNSFAKSTDKNLTTLSAKRLTDTVYGDWQSDIAKAFNKWKNEVSECIRIWIDSVWVNEVEAKENGKSGSCGTCTSGCNKPKGTSKNGKKLGWHKECNLSFS